MLTLSFAIHPKSATYLFTALLMSCISQSFAHPELQQQIDDVTSQIAVLPTSGVLYLRRGELNSLHANYAAALADYAAAEANGADVDGVLLARGRAYMDAGRLDDARAQLDRLVHKSPRLAAAHLAVARLCELTSQSLAAADAYGSAIELSDAPRPEIYLARARCYTAAGSQFHPNAIASLNEGVKRIGPVISLQLAAVELESRAGLTTAAAARLEKIAASAARPETYLVDLSELYAKAGDASAAASAAARAKVAIASLPLRLRQTSATLALLTRLEQLGI